MSLPPAVSHPFSDERRTNHAQGGVVEINEITDRVLGAAVEVHRRLGPGLLESTYAACQAAEMAKRSIRFRREVALSVQYDEVSLNCGYRIDFLVEERVVVELKAQAQLQPVHTAQLITYLRLGNYPVGLLINFNAPYLGNGAVRRIVNRYQGPKPNGQG